MSPLRRNGWSGASGGGSAAAHHQVAVGDRLDRQVADAHVGLVHGNGGVLSSQVTALLGDASTI